MGYFFVVARLLFVCCQVQWNTLLNVEYTLYFLGLFSTLFLSFSVQVFIYFAMSGHIHSVNIQFSQFDRLFGLVASIRYNFCPFLFSVRPNHFSFSSQRQSILLPTEWPCIFSVFFSLSRLHIICLHFDVFVLVFIHCAREGSYNENISRCQYDFFFQIVRIIRNILHSIIHLLLHDFDHAILLTARLLQRFVIFIWINSAPRIFFAIENGSEKPQKTTIEKKGSEIEWINVGKKSVQIGSSGVDIEAVYH